MKIEFANPGTPPSQAAIDSIAALLVDWAERDISELRDILDEEISVTDAVRVSVVRFSDRRHYQLQYLDWRTGRKRTKSSGIERNDDVPQVIAAAEAKARELEIELTAERLAVGEAVGLPDAIPVTLPHTKCCACEQGVRYIHAYPPHEITVRGKTYRITVPVCYENHGHHESLWCAMEWLKRTKRVSFTGVDPVYECEDSKLVWRDYSSFIKLCAPEDRLRSACRRLAPPWSRYYCVEDVRSHYGKLRLKCFGCGKVATLNNHDGFLKVEKSYVGDGRRPNEGRLFCGTECQYETKDVEFIRWQREKQRSQMNERQLALDDVRTAKACVSAIQKFARTNDREALQSLMEELQPPVTSPTSSAR